MDSEYRPYMHSFPISPFVGRDFPYGMPTSMTTGFCTNPSMFSDNTTTMLSPINMHLASGSAISDHSLNFQS